MPLPLTLNVMAAVALGFQFLIFLYLYRANRVRFFRYVVWAWGCFLVHKVLIGAQYALPHPAVLGGMAAVVGIIGTVLIAAAGLAFRWNYTVRPLHALAVAVYALSAAAIGRGEAS